MVVKSAAEPPLCISVAVQSLHVETTQTRRFMFMAMLEILDEIGQDGSTGAILDGEIHRLKMLRTRSNETVSAAK